MCLMPFSKDTGTREHDNYCSFCYRDGQFVYQGDDLKEFQCISYKGMTEGGMSKPVAWFFSWMIRFAPYWKNKK